MINPDLVHVLNFLNKNFPIQELEELEKTGISQLEVRYNSREFREKTLKGTHEVEFRIKTYWLKNLSSEYKLYVYIFLRLIANYTDSKYYRTILEDYQCYLNKRTFSNNERYFYLSSLQDNLFVYEIDTELFQEDSRRYFNRMAKNIVVKENKNLLQVTRSIIQSANFVFLPKEPPKRLQRHKGYRDHGSLGSEFSKTLKDQGTDFSIKEEIEQEIKEKKDFLNLLLGLGGWI